MKGFFYEKFEACEKPRCFRTVKQPMIGGKGTVHDGSMKDFIIPGQWFCLCGTYGQHTGLRWVDHSNCLLNPIHAKIGH